MRSDPTVNAEVRADEVARQEAREAALEKSRENRARRQLKVMGMYLQKTPARSWLRYYGAGYMVVSSYSNVVQFGCWTRAFEATLEEVEQFIADERVEADAN